MKKREKQITGFKLLEVFRVKSNQILKLSL